MSKIDQLKFKLIESFNTIHRSFCGDIPLSMQLYINDIVSVIGAKRGEMAPLHKLDIQLSDQSKFILQSNQNVIGQCSDINDDQIHYTLIPIGTEASQNILVLYDAFCEPETLQVIKSLVETLEMALQSLQITDHTFSSQLVSELINQVDEGIIILDEQCYIICFNDFALRQLPEIKKMANISDTISGLATLQKNKFKNGKISINVNSVQLSVIVNTIQSHHKFYHIINIKSDWQPCAATKRRPENCKKLLSYLSHEIRNPLQTVILGCTLMKYDTEPKIERINTILKSCKDLGVIVDDILDYSKLEANELTLNIENVMVEDVIRDVVEEFNGNAKLKNIELVYDIEENIDTIYSDPTRLNQILTNLVSNSIKYSQVGTVKISVESHTIGQTQGVLFKVSDTGIGIKTNEIENLFKDYGKANRSFSQDIKSNGLGLSISQKLANLLGGYIKVESEYTKGSVFTLYHPKNLGGTINPDNTEFEGLVGRLLIVDDMEDSLSFLQLLIENINCKYSCNIQVEVAIRGEQALELCKINRYCMVLIDKNLKDADGISISKILRNTGYNGKIVLMTGDITVRLESNIINDIIYKPFSDVGLMDILSRHLQQKKVGDWKSKILSLIGR